jgi:hypothetical protein
MYIRAIAPRIRQQPKWDSIGCREEEAYIQALAYSRGYVTATNRVSTREREESIIFAPYLAISMF